MTITRQGRGRYAGAGNF